LAYNDGNHTVYKSPLKRLKIKIDTKNFEKRTKCDNSQYGTQKGSVINSLLGSNCRRTLIIEPQNRYTASYCLEINTLKDLIVSASCKLFTIRHEYMYISK